jgi:hypothetical protein
MPNPTKFSWTEPTTNTDGTAIAAGEITGYTVGARLTTAAGSAAGTYPFTFTVQGAGMLSAPLSNFSPALSPGSYAAAVQAIGPENSAWSTEATFTIAETPSAPGNFSVA